MSSENPCAYDCTDFPDPDVTDLGCCQPYPLRRSCEAPILPTPNCDEQDPVVTFDEDTETFTILSTLYDSECSALADSNNSLLTGLLA